MGKFTVGSVVSTIKNGGMTGQIAAVVNENTLTGDSYIVKILYRGNFDSMSGIYEERGTEKKSKTWADYEYEYTVLSESDIMLTQKALLETLMSMGEIPRNLLHPDSIVLMQEQTLRDAVKKLKIPDIHLSAFLEKAAKDYLKVSKKKGEILEIYPFDFIVRLKIVGLGIRHIRIPVADFFMGASSVGVQETQMLKDMMFDKKIKTTPLYGNGDPSLLVTHKDTEEYHKKMKNSSRKISKMMDEIAEVKKVTKKKVSKKKGK